MAGCRRRGLQHCRGCAHHPHLPGRQLPHVDYQDHAYGEHRPLELLAFRLHRCRSLFRDGREPPLGLFRSHRVLHLHLGVRRPHGREVSEILRPRRHFHPAAFLPELHAARHHLQQTARQDSRFLQTRHRCRGTEEKVWRARRATGARCHRGCLDRLGGTTRHQENPLPRCYHGSRDGADSPYHLAVYRRIEANL